MEFLQNYHFMDESPPTYSAVSHILYVTIASNFKSSHFSTLKYWKKRTYLCFSLVILFQGMNSFDKLNTEIVPAFNKGLHNGCISIGLIQKPSITI
jgi:hypothetical protein